METLTSDPHSAPPGAHFLEFLWTRQTQAISASEAIPIGRLWTARDCYTQDRFFAGPPRIATLVPQVPRTGRARNVSLWLLQTVMLPGVSRDVDISQKCRIGVRNVGSQASARVSQLRSGQPPNCLPTGAATGFGSDWTDDSGRTTP